MIGRSVATAGGPALNPDEIHLRRLLVALLAALRRQIKLIAVLVAAALALGIAYIIITPSAYTAQSSILIDLKQPNLYNGSQGVQLAVSDPAAVDSQVEILESESLALKVIREMHLVDRADEISSPSLLKLPLRWMFSLFGSGGDNAYARERGLLVQFMQNTTVKRQGTTYVVTVAFEALDPQLASDIANHIATTYLADQVEARYDTTRKANSWLEGRVEEMRGRVLDAERAVADYKSANDLVQSEGVFLSERDLSQLNSQLLMARADSAEKKAKLDQINTLIKDGNPDALSSDTVNSPILADLRKQYTDLGLREAMIQRRFPDDSKKSVDVTQREKEDVKRQMIDELKRIGDGAQSAYQVALSRQKSLEDSLNKAKNLTAGNSDKQVKLAELQRQADASRTLYENFLGRLRQTGQDASFPIPEARILTEATRPLRPSSPRILRILAMAGAFGAMLGIGIALVRDRLDNVVRSAWELESLTGLPVLGIIPLLGLQPAGPRYAFARNVMPTLVKGRTSEPSERRAERRGPPERHVADPLVRTTETMRAIKVALQGLGDNPGVKVVSAVSALPGEGKSTVNLALAKHLAWTGKRVVLIDGDLRRAHPAGRAEQLPDGLIQVVRGEAALAGVMRSDEATGLHLLSAGRQDGEIHSEELLRSQNFRAVIEVMTRSYDYVVLDLPPLLSTVDARVAASIVDRFVYIVEWERTSRDAILQALHVSPVVTSKMAGVVMNKVRLDMLHMYDGNAAVFTDPYYGHFPEIEAGGARA